MCSREDLNNLQIVADLLEVMEEVTIGATMVTTKVVMVEAILEILVHPDTDPEELCPGNLKEQATIITNP